MEDDDRWRLRDAFNKEATVSFGQGGQPRIQFHREQARTRPLVWTSHRIAAVAIFTARASTKKAGNALRALQNVKAFMHPAAEIGKGRKKERRLGPHCQLVREQCCPGRTPLGRTCC